MHMHADWQGLQDFMHCAWCCADTGKGAIITPAAMKPAIGSVVTISMHHAWRYFHAGAGAIISSAAMKRASFQDVEDFALNIPPQSGDSLTHKIFWQVMDLAPTDPGMFCLPQLSACRWQLRFNTASEA